MPSRNVFYELCFKLTLLRSKKNLTGVCNAVYFRLCIDLMQITPPVTAEHYLPLDGMINIPKYLVRGCWVQLIFFFFADHITSNNGYMKHAHTRQRMTNNNYNNKRKQV